MTAINTRYMRDPRKLRAFVAHYVGDCHFNASKAAEAVGVSKASAGQQGYMWLKHPEVQKMVDEKLEEVHMSAGEALKQVAEIGRSDLGVFYKVAETWLSKPPPYCEILEEKEEKYKSGSKTYRRIKYLCRYMVLDTEKLTDPQYSHLLQEFSQSSTRTKIKLHGKLDAIDKVLRVHGKYNDNLTINPGRQPLESTFRIPADEIAPLFAGAYRDITHHNHTEYIFKGGRGSAKSSFVAEIVVELLVNNPDAHALALRQVGETLRDSVFAQVQWAINKLGLSDKFKSTLSPMEIEYLPTGQKVYFRGGDDPGKIKSITPTFGYIKIVWFEELDQFRGLNAIRTIEQSIRGGDDIIYLKSFNPPPTRANWANKYLEIPKDTRYVHHSNYLGLPEAYLKDEKMREAMPLNAMIPAYANLAVPPEWLGNTWLEEAEHLRVTNPMAYEHEYLGIPVNDGGLVFPNVILRPITDDEIAQFDRVLRGLDWGYAINPASFGVMNYDATRRILHIFAEGQYLRMSNERLFKAVVDDGLLPKVEYTEKRQKIVSYPDLVIADSAEPKSVGDWKSYGANIRGAEKGPESVRYSIKWLQGLTAIVIDPVRAPKHAQEFSNYEYERTKDNEIIDEYPDRDNDTIDDVRYATNLIWRKRGE